MRAPPRVRVDRRVSALLRSSTVSTTTQTGRFKTATRWLLGVLFAGAGANHFVMTDFYVGIMPPYLPWPLALVYLSGVAEAGVGILLLFRRWAVWGGWGIIAVCVAVFPANLHMAMHPELFPQFSEIALWVRLPLQAVVMLWAYWYTCGYKESRRLGG